MARKHKILVIGAGSIGERHVRSFRETGRAEVELCDIDAETVRPANQYDAVMVHTDLDAALGAGAEAAVVATTAERHVGLATRVVEAGLHVFVEKPLSTSFDGVERLRRLVADRKVVAAVTYVYRVHPALVAMREAICDGQFGRPVELVAAAGHFFPSVRPAYRTNYYADRATGGGAIQDALTHLVNAGEWLMGPIDRLIADARHQLLAGVEVEDTVHLLARHGTALASYALNQCQTPNEATITVVCQDGTARLEAHRHRWRWKSSPDEPWHDERHEAAGRETLFLAQAHALLDALEERIPPPCSLEDGIQTLRVNLAALASVEQGAWQTLSP